MSILQVSIPFRDDQIILETGKIANDTDGSVFVSYKGTRILCVFVYDKKASGPKDFLPLSTLYLEKYSAVGRIPGGFFKRETKPTEHEILTSRIIDRSVRPIFDPAFTQDCNLICTVFSYEHGTDSDVLALIGASAALAMSGAPLQKTIAGVKVGRNKDGFHIGSSNSSDINMFVSGSDDSILMIESQSEEVADDVILDAIDFASAEIARLTPYIIDFAQRARKLKDNVDFVPNATDLASLESDIEKEFGKEIETTLQITSKIARYEALADITKRVEEKFLAEDASPKDALDLTQALKNVKKGYMRKRIAEENIRIDGRSNTEIRPITCELGVLPNAHGSALFTRGETQALVSLTIGGSTDEQIIDLMASNEKDAFMLHYNFPSYSVGEVGRYGPSSRREIGHGNLAKRALMPFIPTKIAYPNTIRIVSDITQSNGSTSMATVCGGTLAMINGGVPMKKTVGGIAMGLIKEGDKVVVLSDILGDEDFLGDMDFKVAGTKDGITALQMDMKISGIGKEIITQAVEQAKEGKAHIIGIMDDAIKEASDSGQKVTHSAAQQSVTIDVPAKYARLVIGQGGAVIKNICFKSGAKVNLDSDTQKATILSADSKSIDIAVKMIKSIVDREENKIAPKEGEIYKVKVVKLIEHGAIVEMHDKVTSGMVHISEICLGKVQYPSEALVVDETIFVKFLGGFGDKNKFSMRMVNQYTGKEMSVNNG